MKRLSEKIKIRKKLKFEYCTKTVKAMINSLLRNAKEEFTRIYVHFIFYFNEIFPYCKPRLIVWRGLAPSELNRNSIKLYFDIIDDKFQVLKSRNSFLKL